MTVQNHYYVRSLFDRISILNIHKDYKMKHMTNIPKNQSRCWLFIF